MRPRLVIASLWLAVASISAHADVAFESGREQILRALGQTTVAQLALVRTAAERGDMRAQMLVGYLYLYGVVVTADDAEAIKWLRRSAAQGEPAAQFALGRMYYRGQGIQRDLVEGLRLMTQAAERGNAAAQMALGVLYSQADGVPQNYTTAYKWYQAAAQQGFADAKSSLGWLTYQGWGVKRDDAEAFRLTLEGAGGPGSAKAAYNLGLFYERGVGTPVDFVQAASWYRSAAERGNGWAQVALGVLYRDGAGVPKDLVEAYMWISLGSIAEGYDGVVSTPQIAELMTATQIAKAQRRAAVCGERSFKNCSEPTSAHDADPPAP